MAHRKTTTGSTRTMRRTLMGGAVVSTLLIASLAPASAGCLSQQVRINAQIVDYSNTQSKQLGVNWNGAAGAQNSGGQLRWAPTDDFRLNTRYGNFNQERPEPQANRGGRETFGGSTREGVRYDSPRLGSVVIPQAQNRYRNEFGGVQIVGGETVQWGQGLNNYQPSVNLANQIQRIDVRRQPIPRLGKIPAIKFLRDRSASNRAEVIIQVTPRIIPVNER